MLNEEEIRTEPHPTSQAKDKKWDKGSALERMKDMRDRNRPKPYPYRFYEYHALKITSEEVFLQVGDKEMFLRPTF